ncbi:unnamed protein product [Cunninghamella echinulata]
MLNESTAVKMSNITEESSVKLDPNQPFNRFQNAPVSFTSNFHTIEQSRKVINTIRQYGELVEYKTLKCPETQSPLRYGFVVFKYQEMQKELLTNDFKSITQYL